jgi:hypothetical protein
MFLDNPSCLPNAFVTGIFCVADFCGTVAKPPQKEAKQKISG